MQWTADLWPIIGQPGVLSAFAGEPVTDWVKPVRTETESERETHRELRFTDITGRLVPGWQWNANPSPVWMQPAENGGIYLTALQVSSRRPLADYPNLLLRKWEAPAFKVQADMDLTEMAEGTAAGMMSMGLTYGGIAVENIENGCRICKITGTQVFDAGMVYADEKREYIQITRDIAQKIRFTLEVIPTNNVAALSYKPEYKEGEESKVLHPEEEVRIIMQDRGGRELVRIAVPGSAGRWVGAKYGFFHVKMGLDKKWQGTETEEIGCVKISDVILT